MPLIRHGGGGARTDLVCGYLHSEDPLFDPAMRALPPVFVVRLPEGAAAALGAGQHRVLARRSPLRPTSRPSLISTRLPELVLIEVLRVHLATAPAADQGWLAALRDPVLAPALSLLHRSPERKWTVAELASGAAVSRSVLDERFRHVLGRSPIRYLTEWRMHLAEGAPRHHRHRRWSPSPGGSATTRRRRSAGRSSGPTVRRRATGGPLDPPPPRWPLGRASGPGARASGFTHAVLPHSWPAR